MPQTIEVVVRLTISEQDYDVKRLEERVRAAREEGGRELFVRAVEALEQEALEAHPGAVRQRQVERHLDTTLGRVSFRRWRVKSQGQSFCLLDRLLGLPRSSRASPLAKKRGSELATRVTYREAGRLLSEELGTPISAQSVHGWVQAMGREVEEKEIRPAEVCGGGPPAGRGGVG